jgi:hypothetical protein
MVWTPAEPLDILTLRRKLMSQISSFEIHFKSLLEGPDRIGAGKLSMHSKEKVLTK